MSDVTRIEWADATWNPMTGCTPVSEACEHCYAERMARRFNLRDLAPGERVSIDNYFAPRFHPDRLDAPLHWRKPRRIFVCSMSDLFHEAFADEQISRVFNVMWRQAPQHIYLVLTKRPERMREYVTREWVFKQPTRAEGTLPLPNVWLGVTVENQQRADERIPILLDTPAAVRFISVEPMLGPVRLGCREDEMGFTWLFGPEMSRGIDWVILGGETGPGARPMQPEWALDVYGQCKAAGVPFFFKKWGDEMRRRTPIDPISGIPEWLYNGPMPHHYAKMVATRDFPEVPR